MNKENTALIELLNSDVKEKNKRNYYLGTPLCFFGFTNGTVPQEGSVGILYESSGFLCAEGLMKDCDLYNQARKDNDFTWLLGDTFELMIRCPEHEDYYEFHSTPEGFRLQLHVQDYRTFRSVPHEKKICDCGLEVQNEYDAEEQLWHCVLRVPLARLCISSLHGCSFVLVRQNHTHGKEKPEITATQVFPQTAHYPPLWHEIQ